MVMMHSVMSAKSSITSTHPLEQSESNVSDVVRQCGQYDYYSMRQVEKD